MKQRIQLLISNPLFSGSLVMVIGSNASNFLNYLYHLMMGRLLGPASYGELASLISLLTILTLIPTSIGLAITKYVAESKDPQEVGSFISALNKKMIILAILMMVGVSVMLPTIANYLHISNYLTIFLAYSTIVFILPTMVNRSALQGLLKFKELIISLVSENIFRLVLGLLFLYLGYALTGVMFGWVLATAIAWGVSVYALKSFHQGKQKAVIDYKSLLIVVLPILIQTLSTTSLYSADIILVKHFFNNNQAGNYAAVSTLGKIIFFGTGPIAAVMFPLIAKRKISGEKYTAIFLLSFFASLMLSLCLLVIYGVFPEIALRSLYGTAYLNGKDSLFLYGIFITLFTLANLLINFFVSSGRSKLVIFPFIAALFQILGISVFHQSLYQVIIVSIIVCASLLFVLLGFFVKLELLSSSPLSIKK